MKKLLASLLTLTILLCAFSTVSFAADASDAVFKVEYADGSATVYCADTTELNAAIKTTTDTFITMLKDYTETTIRMTFPENENDVVLDLGGHTWIYKKARSNPAVAISGKNVTIKNGTLNYTNTYNASSTATRPVIYTYTNGSVLNLENVTITGECTRSDEKIRGIYTNDNSVKVTVNMTNVTIDATECIFLGNGDTFNIYGGNYISTGDEMITSNSNNFQYTNVNLYGGTFSNSWSDIIFKSTTKINIADGYHEVANADGTYSIVRKPVTVNKNITETYDDGKGTKTSRFFADINTLDVAEAGFEVTTTIEGETYTWTIELNEVYSKVIANDVTYNAQNYILTGAIGDVPSDFDGEFEVKVYTKDFEGNTNYIG